MVGITGITMEIAAVRNTTGIDIKVRKGAGRRDEPAPFPIDSEVLPSTFETVVAITEGNHCGQAETYGDSIGGAVFERR